MMIFVYWGILILCYFIASRLRSMASRFGFLDKSMMAVQRSYSTVMYTMTPMNML